MGASLEERVREAWASLGTPLPGLVVAVSGGPDSVALARALVAVRPGPEVPVLFAHLNHLLRGEESEKDEAFVADLHARLAGEVPNLHLACQRLDVAAIARAERGNLEAVARRERYRWLAELAQQHGLGHVATGHTASDQAETVLFRLLRGTGLDGLRGIAFRRTLAPGIEAVRPLLQVSREEVVSYLNDLGQIVRHDTSNDDRERTRNRIRHELLPLLKKDYNPRIVAILGRLARQADEVSRAEEELAAEVLAKSERPRAGRVVVLGVEQLREVPERLVRGALRLVWRRESWPMGEMGHDDYERVARLVEGERGGCDLPGGVRARRVGGVLRLGQSSVPGEGSAQTTT